MNLTDGDLLNMIRICEIAVVDLESATKLYGVDSLQSRAAITSIQAKCDQELRLRAAQKRAAEEKRLADEKAAAEAERAAQKRAAEEKRLADEKAAAEAEKK